MSYSDIKQDFHPKSWLSRYRQASVKYLLIMGLYYHGLGIAAAYGGTVLIEQLDPTYQIPDIPVSLFEVIAAGPIEETLFFGIPFYATGNHYIVLALGSVWAFIHILNTDLFNFSSLAYGNFMFAAVSLFYSLRTWASGKGWFSIAFHSGWNGAVFASACGVGEMPCDVIGAGDSVFMIAGIATTSAILLAINYLLYRARKEKTASLSILAGGYTSVQPELQPGQKGPSAAWYLVPVFLGIIGGAIMYFAVRDRDQRMAKKGLLVGVLLFIVKIAIIAIADIP